MSSEAPCDICGGVLDITATIIGCRNCGTVWGRCNGGWVEVPRGYLDPPYVPFRAGSICGKDDSSPGSAYRGTRSKECPYCDGDPYVQHAMSEEKTSQDSSNPT